MAQARLFTKVQQGRILTRMSLLPSPLDLDFEAIVSDAIRTSDIGGLLDERDISRHTAAVSASWKKALEELSPKPYCLECGKACHQRKDARKVAIVVDTHGLTRMQHIPRRCRSSGCKNKDLMVWYSFVQEEKGRLRWSATRGELPQIVMMTRRFGVTRRWYEQASIRLLKQHSSFQGEAETLHSPGFLLSLTPSLASESCCQSAD